MPDVNGAAAGAAILVMSIATVAATTQVADNSYCRPGPPVPGLAEEYCDS
jgi:hypothetical protein